MKVSRRKKEIVVGVFRSLILMPLKEEMLGDLTTLFLTLKEAANPLDILLQHKMLQASTPLLKPKSRI